MKLIRIIKKWDWPELMLQTPGHTGIWDNIQFTEEPVEKCDYLIILNNLEIDVQLKCPSANIWRIIQEPPVEFFKSWHVNPTYSAKTLTCDPQLSGPEYLRSHPMLPWHINRDYNFLKYASIPVKTKMLSWITSTKNKLNGHKRRLIFLNLLRDKIDELDLLGGGIYHLTNQEQKKRNEEKQRQLGFKTIEDKWAGLAPYKYSLAVENYCGPDYWSEKIGDCFLAWTVPIYYGCTNLEDYFPKESFIRIDIDKFEEAIRTIKTVLSEDSWEKRIEALTEARDLVLNKYQLFSSITRHIKELDQQEIVHETIRLKPTNILNTHSKGGCYKDEKKETRLSVVVCTYNRAQLLRYCLESLANQSTNKELYEVLVIDNNSKDNTLEVTNEFVEKYSNFRYLFESQQGLSHARNLGIKEAAADYIAYIDDDVRAPQEWINIALNIIDNYEPDIFGGPSSPSDITSLPPWFKVGYRSVGIEKKYGWIKEGIIVGCNFFIKKSLLVEYGGFDPHLGMTGENISFHEETVILFRAYKEKRKVYFHYDLKVNHEVHEYAINVAYYIFIKYQLSKEKYHLFKKKEFELSDLYDLLNHINEFFQDFEKALRKRDKNKFPYPENYIIQHTTNYIPFIVDRLEFFRSRKKLYLILSDEIKKMNDLDFISKKIVENKKILKLFFMIIIKKIKLLFKKFKIKKRD